MEETIARLRTLMTKDPNVAKELDSLCNKSFRPANSRDNEDPSGEPASGGSAESAARWHQLVYNIVKQLYDDADDGIVGLPALMKQVKLKTGKIVDGFSEDDKAMLRSELDRKEFYARISGKGLSGKISLQTQRTPLRRRQ